jgi:hypothetical protein
VRPFALLLACASLVACGGDPAEQQANRAEAVGEPTGGAPAEAAPPSAEAGNISSGPAPAPVPAAFRGTWAETEALCGDPADPSRLVIAGRTLRFHASVLEVARVEQLGPREINIVSTAAGEGTTRPAEYHVSIDAAGDTLTDQGGGGMVRRRCEG